jgi:MraZ protein
MLIGEYTHLIDTKKRLSLPKKFRAELGKKVVVTRGLDNCLFMYPMNAWKETAKRLQELSFAQADTRGFNRFMLSGAVEVDVDSVGRILVPDFLKDFAKLSARVVLAGVNDRVEIWNEKSWIEYKKRIEKQADAMAEKLGEIGAL